jgi:hypothetical protein
MTTYDNAPTFKEFALMRLSMLASKRAKQTRERLTSPTVNAGLVAFIRVVLHLAGFALLTIAAFRWNIIAGYSVAGFSCFVLSTLMARGGTNDETEGGKAQDLRTGR